MVANIYAMDITFPQGAAGSQAPNIASLMEEVRPKLEVMKVEPDQELYNFHKDAHKCLEISQETFEQICGKLEPELGAKVREEGLEHLQKIVEKFPDGKIPKPPPVHEVGGPYIMMPGPGPRMPPGNMLRMIPPEMLRMRMPPPEMLQQASPEMQAMLRMRLPRATLYVNLRSMELPRADSYVKLRTMELPGATLYVHLRTMELPKATSYVNLHIL